MQSTIDPNRVQEFAFGLLDDLGATVSGALIHLGDRLGLYRAMAEAGPLTSAALADRTGTYERFVREWLANQCAAGYIHYDAEGATYLLPSEHAAVLADESSPAFMAGGFTTAIGAFQVLDKIENSFRTGEGIGWEDHDEQMFCGVERFFAPAYRTHLVAEWIPSIDGLPQRLSAGARVADVGCGHGATAILIAKAFPNVEVVGFDVHQESIDVANQRAVEAGVADRVRFVCATAQDFPGDGFDLITFFDCLHDMGDPIEAAAHARRALSPDGVAMLVEPMAGDRLEDNLSPVGRAYYGFSTLICTPAAHAQHGPCCLGAQAGETRLREVLAAGGFQQVRRAHATPLNMILEARP